MMLVLNLSRINRELVFHVKVPCGRQGHMLEVMGAKELFGALTVSWSFA